MTMAHAAARRARIKLIGSILTTHGYAVLGFAVIQPVLSGTFSLPAYRLAGLLVGIAVQAFAIYIAPYGEPQ